MSDYAELCAATHYSFLRGASPPADMVRRAMALGMTGIGIADRNSVAGVVRAHVALRRTREDAAEEGLTLPPFRLIVGARLCFADDTPDIIAYPANRKGWGRLTRLLSCGNLRSEKGDCTLFVSDLDEFIDEDMALIILPGTGRGTVRSMVEGCGGVTAAGAAAPPPSDVYTSAATSPCRGGIYESIKSLTPHVWIGAAMPHSGADRRYLARLHEAANNAGLPLLATNMPLFTTPEQRPLHDILTCIAEKTTISQAGRLLIKNAESHLKSPAEMARLFARHPEAITATQTFLSGINFTLDELSYHYPEEPVPEGWSPQGWLEHLVWEAARLKHPQRRAG